MNSEHNLRVESITFISKTNLTGPGKALTSLTKCYEKSLYADSCKLLGAQNESNKYMAAAPKQDQGKKVEAELERLASVSPALNPAVLMLVHTVLNPFSSTAPCL